MKSFPELILKVLLLSLNFLLHLKTPAGRSVQARTCRDLWHLQSKRESGNYEIDVDGDGPLQPIWVYCDMGTTGDPHHRQAKTIFFRRKERCKVKFGELRVLSAEGFYDLEMTGTVEPSLTALPELGCKRNASIQLMRILTVVHHDTENPTDVRGHEASGSYVRNVTYGKATEAHLMTLIDLSFSCQQYIKWACKGSTFGFWYPPGINSWWVGRNWKNQYYWGGAETDSRSCGCHPYCKATFRNSTCNCDANDKTKWLGDSGLILDSSRLPVLQLRFGDTGESNEAGQHTLGPLICRAVVGHREVHMGTLKAPVQLITPGYEIGKYPPPFHKYTWTVKIPQGETMELVFPEYDVVHYGSYNVVPDCRSVVTVRAKEDSAGETVVIMRQKSPPYYVSEGSQTTLNITLTTCNQDPNVPLGKGFKAYVRRTECGGCNPGLGQNGGTTFCTGVCGIIASEEYPFPHNYYFSSDASNYTHTWVLRVLQHHVVELEFSDFDIPAHPGSRNCTPERGVLWAYNGDRAVRKNLIGGFCNLNRQGVIYSNTNTMTLVFATRWRKVGNGRGFHGVYRGVHRMPLKESISAWKIGNVAKGKPASQISTRDGRNALLGVDGHDDPTDLSKTCTATEISRDPWWQVNLQKRHLIYGVEIRSTKTEAQLSHSEEGPSWPPGEYGLPMPVSGCPSSRGFKWKTGYRYHDMAYDVAEDNKVQHWSDGMLLKGGLQTKVVGGVEQKSGVLQYFCMKMHNSNADTYQWKPGEYCIYQYGISCPEGFHSGYITWLDKQGTHSESTISGYTPKGSYSPFTTTIYFCCRFDGNPEVAIQLPADRPFYLLKYGKSCQKVEGMSDTEQFFHFNEDVPSMVPSDRMENINGRPKYKKHHPKIDKNTFEKGISLSYCYYDISQSLRGFRIIVDDTGLVATFARYYDDLSYGISHTEYSNFLNAYTCAVYPVTESEFSVLKLDCTQPVYGQYVTLQVYDRYDSLQFCEIKVFGVEDCGQPLGMASEEIYDSQVTATSNEDDDHFYHTNGRLNADSGWCAAFEDPDKEFRVDLTNITTVTGIILQGLGGASKATYVQQFYLLLSNDSISWISEEEPVGNQKVYVCDQCESNNYTNDLQVRFNLLKGIPARHVLIKILKYKEAPCLRAEILGCREKVPCTYTMTTTSGEIASPNYPNYYGQDKSCWWLIEPEPGKFIELSFVTYDLAEKEEDYRSGTCHDQLTVYPSYGNESIIRSPDGKLFPKLIVSKDKMKIHLESCFHYSLSRYRGFHATYKAVDCHGCGIGDYQCSQVHLCEHRCGRIVSIGYPLPYQNSHRCRWLIRVYPSQFIKLTFLEFDVVGGENCLNDYVEIYDGETNDKDNLIGRFCNAKKPPTDIVSNWYALLIIFSTDAEVTGRGFSLKYISQSSPIPNKIQSYYYDDDQACPKHWKHYNGYCYNAFHENEALQWYEAEAKCRAKGEDGTGHLISILDKNENAVVHFFLTNFWNAQHKSLYIGLNDEAREGVYRWSDGNPMIYTDWARAGRTIRTQPDGGAYQDCTMLRVDSGHSTAHWHDIPCSLGKLAFHNSDDIYWPGDNTSDQRSGDKESLASISSYICKMKSMSPGGPNEFLTPIPAQIEAAGSAPPKVADEKYFLCRNREIISTLFVCDGAENCRDGSDEESCPTGSCLESSFRCANGRCVSVAAYCDSKYDCPDQFDESRCDHRECEPGEFQCRNGQCIPYHQRCDLLPNCYDKSDEHDCRGSCNPNSTFQCYDGTCIPRYTLCDGHKDCPGKYHEDEQLGCYKKADKIGKDEEKKLCSNRARRTCRDLFILDDIKTDGTYTIDPDGMDGPIAPFTVYCEIGPTLKDVKTIVHHDSEYPIYVKSGRDGSGSYSRELVYNVPMENIKALTEVSTYCRQYISWMCTGTGFGFDTLQPISWWVSWDGKPQYSWGGSKRNGTCGCYPNCKQTTRPCNCDAVSRFESEEDSGYIEEKNKLPIREIRIGNTFRTGQNGTHYTGPLECFAGDEAPEVTCSNSTSYMSCQTGHYVPVTFRCLYEFDQYGYHRGCRDVTHLRNCEDFVCPEDYVKCPKSYCVPTMYVCDGKWDCIGGGDEEDCDSYNCPGQYKCYNRSSCLPLRFLCDGVRQCPHGDDELLCDLVCPAGCHCVGLYVSCMRQNVSALSPALPKEVRKLDFSFNRIDLQHADFSPYVTLGELILQYNYLTVLPPKRFLELRNLYKLDLSNNRLTVISTSAFEGLKNIRILYLENNPWINNIEPEAFYGLSNLPSLNLTGISLPVLRKKTFNGMASLRTLNLSNNLIRKVETGAFIGLHSVTILDIQGNDISDFSANIFTGLKSLEYLYSDSYTFCCMASSQVPGSNCQPPPDEISSCEDLMSSPVQRSFLWVLGTLALVGNLFVIVWRIKTKDSSRISSTLILSLGFADFLMGVYLIIIASVDVHYRSIYIENSDNWRKSTLCKICGFLSTVSSEVSILTLVFITLDRLICLCFPLSQKRFTLQFTYKLIAFSWFAAALMAALPLVIEPYFRGMFYARSGVCLALHITNHRPAGWEYSVAIFFCINLVAFIVIVSAYAYMYMTIRKSYQNMNRLMIRRSRENKIGRQMALIVMTNSLCWFPIIVMGLMAMSGVKVTGEAYAWTAVFVLPLNSATNPLIYTISSLHFHTSLLSRFGLTSKDYRGSYGSKLVSPNANANHSKRLRDQLNSRPFRPPPGYLSLLQYLRTVPDLKPRHLLKIAAAVCKILKELHEGSYALGGLDVNAVFVSEWKTGDDVDSLQVYVPDFNAYKIANSPISGMPDDTAVDMEEFGLLVKKMLRVYHVMSRSNDPMQGTAC